MSVKAAVESGKFTLNHLTLAINKSKTPKTRLAQLGIFEEKGIHTTTADIEFKDGKLILVTEKARGEAGDTLDRPNRDIHTFRAIHLPVSGTLLADDLQDVRAFGAEFDNGQGGEQFDTVINEMVTRQRQSLELTLEMLRFGALRGKVLGKAGNVILDLFNTFGLTENANVDTIAKTEHGYRNQFAKSLRESKVNQAGVKASRYRALCSASFMDALMTDTGFAKAYERYQDGAAFREDVRAGIMWDGILFEEHTEQYPNGDLMIPEGEALLIPENNAGLFVTRFCPANYNETVNTVGLPMYAKVDVMKFDKGLDTEAQMNPIVVNTSPLAVRVLKLAAATKAAK